VKALELKTARRLRADGTTTGRKSADYFKGNNMNTR